MGQSYIQVPVDSSGKKVDTQVTATAAQHRQVFVIGDPSIDAAVAPVDATKGLKVDLTSTGANSTALKVDASATTQPVSVSSLPLPTGASTAAKQPALGTAGTASSDVLTVQGIASMTPLKVDGSGVTQPVSGTVTANAGTNMSTAALALETGGNLAAAKSDLDTLAGAVSAGKVLTTETSAAAIKTDLDSIVTNTTGSATAANQSTANTSLSTIATNTAANATAANQTNGNQQTKLTNGTNIADVVAGDTGFNGVAIANGIKTYPFTTSASGAQTLLADTPVEGYSWIEIIYSSVGSGLALTGQYSPSSGGTYKNTSSFMIGDGGNSPTSALGVTVATLYSGPVRGNFFQIAVSALTSGTFTGIVTLRALPPTATSLMASQNGTWTVGSNSATGSTFPANAFGQGVLAKTSAPTAATTGNLVAVLGNTMGMPIMAQALLNAAVAVSASLTVVKASAGYLSGVIVSAAGTSQAMTIFDNASAASGTVIGVIPSGATAGQYFPFNMPAANGITCSGSSNNPAVTAAYS
jgi:hypothetical protein